MKYEVHIEMHAENDRIVEKIGQAIESFGYVTVFYVRPIDQTLKRQGPQVFCPRCEEHIDAITKKVPFKNGNGFHIRADCPDCKKFIKFLKQ